MGSRLGPKSQNGGWRFENCVGGSGFWNPNFKDEKTKHGIWFKVTGSIIDSSNFYLKMAEERLER